MNISKTLQVASRDEWRRWLSRHHKTEPDIWLVFYKKASGKSGVSYNDAVEEALCFGWIDSQLKSINSQTYAQRFSPRKTKADYSQPNKERLRILLDEGKVIPEVVASLAFIKDEAFVIAPDILEVIKASKEAWRNFKEFPDGYKRIRISFIEAARNRPKEFQKRLTYFVAMTAKNKQFGFGGVEKYF